MANRTLKIGVAQITQCADIGHNLRRMGSMIAAAKKKHVSLLVFPECAMTGYGPEYHSKSRAAFDPDAVDAAMKEVRDQARNNRMAIMVGTHLPVEGGWTNSALVIIPSGRTAIRYDKAHLYDVDPPFYLPGTSLPKVATVDGVRYGAQICYDIRFPEMFRYLAQKGAQVILTPSFIHSRKDTGKGPVIEAHIRSRAAENGRFVVFANAAGASQCLPSMIAGPGGELLAVAERAKEQLLTATLNLGLVNNNFLKRRRVDLY